MPRGYELNSYYDTMRAINRKLYSSQIKKLSGLIDKLGLRNSDAYRLIIASINDGVYQNLNDLYNRTYFGSAYRPDIPKSAYAQDYMSPMELRLNAIAVRRSAKAIEKLSGSRFSLKDVQDICYAEARGVAEEFNLLKQDVDEFNMKITQPAVSTKAIIKKYDHNIVLGTLPKGELFTSDNMQEIENKQKLIAYNNSIFAQIKNELIARGMTSASMRQTAFARFNMEFYETDVATTHTLEISKILITDKAYDYVSERELIINIEKLKIMNESLQQLSSNASFSEIYSKLQRSGKMARHITLQKHKTLPELFSGFYHTYIDADKKIISTKN